MFNISFGELLLFASVALLVLGPEKLPQTIRSVLLKYRKIKAQLNKLQTDFEQELELIELKQIMKEELKKIKEMEDQLKSQLDEMQSEIASLQDQTISIPVETMIVEKTVIPKNNLSLICAVQPCQIKPFAVPYLKLDRTRLTKESVVA